MTTKKIDRAGVIPYYIPHDGIIQMLFMKPSDPKFGGGTFQIAKGKREKGETPIDAGMREAGEELGLFRQNVISEHYLGKFLGRIDIYVAKIRDKNMFGDPTTPEEVSETMWMTPEKFITTGRKLHIPIIKAANRWIASSEKN